MPKRIQRKRVRGWKMPPDAIYVGRPTCYGNPFSAGAAPTCYTLTTDWKCETQQEAVDRYRAFLLGGFNEDWLAENFQAFDLGDLEWGEALSRLRGRDLACWCKLTDPCHADVLLEIANWKPKQP